jgi:hypothetical protein
LWRRPRPKLGCGAKERRKKKYDINPRLARIYRRKLGYMNSIRISLI